MSFSSSDQRPWESGVFCPLYWTRSSLTPLSSGRSGSVCFLSSGSWYLELEQTRFPYFIFCNISPNCWISELPFWHKKRLLGEITPPDGHNGGPQPLSFSCCRIWIQFHNKFGFVIMIICFCSTQTLKKLINVSSLFSELVILQSFHTIGYCLSFKGHLHQYYILKCVYRS